MIKTPVRFDEATALLLDADERQLADILAFAEMINAGPHIATCINDHETLTAQVAELRDLSDRLKLEAQTHAQEARTANATIAEIYQLCTGGTGEPGSWNGAEPVRKLVAQVAELKGGIVCGQGIQFGNFLVGCGRTIDSPREVYRCYDCDNAFHKHCLKQHCTERKHGG
jgi:hypothetical protein